jgi:hypothetical protein
LPGPVNTNSTLIGAAARCFLRLGAARVVIGEGPGHQRDTELVVQAAGLKPHLAERQIEFVDLNRDELRKVKLKANYSGLGELWLPRAVLESDFVVSMPKVKTHHWAGVTLSLKNMFGIVPGMKYGWPKNPSINISAPGSSSLITAAAVAGEIQSQAVTQKMLAAMLRQEAARVAHDNAHPKTQCGLRRPTANGHD